MGEAAMAPFTVAAVQAAYVRLTVDTRSRPAVSEIIAGVDVD
jgi:hypothetical protein